MHDALTMISVLNWYCLTLSPQFYNRKKTATACAFAKQGRGLIKVNGQPIELLQPESLRLKAFEPVLIIGQEKSWHLATK